MARKAARVSARFSKSLAKAAVASEPREGPLDHPAAGQHDEALRVIAALDDLDAQVGLLGDSGVDLHGVVRAVGPGQGEAGKATTYAVEDHRCAVRRCIASVDTAINAAVCRSIVPSGVACCWLVGLCPLL